MKKTIIDYFEETVRQYGDKIAVSDKNTTYTYCQLRRTAVLTGCRLKNLRIKNQPVVVFMNRSTELTAAMLGVIYSGNFYTILDSDSPGQRINSILNTLKPAAVIYEEEFKETVHTFPSSIRRIPFNGPAELNREDEESLLNIQEETSQESPAYVLFTSGSTGEPKGALLTHQNVISYISWFTEAFNINNETVFGSQTPLHFSMSVSDFYGSMFTGAEYHIIPKEYFAFPAKLIPFMNERKINSIYWVPSAYSIAVKTDLFKYMRPEYLKLALFAGETMPVKYLNYWKNYLPDLTYANLFGPTETTDICSFYVVNKEFEEEDSLPIGKPCSNCEHIILDSNGKEAATGVPGELYIKGPFVAKGYYNNSQMTEKTFVQNPLHSSYPDTVYRTGDIVKQEPDGNLLYVGRKDFQIKHMGYRIEPGEIESVFNSSGKVDLSLCIYIKETDELVLAYEGKENMDEELRLYGKERLPDYMQPSSFKLYDVFPKNINGKTDRKAITKEITEDQKEKENGKNL